jgi:hypothetical protein
MHIRLRKFIGTVVLLVFVTVYMLTAAVVTAVWLDGKPMLVQGLGYAIAGLIWIFPAGAIIWWMSRPSPR